METQTQTHNLYEFLVENEFYISKELSELIEKVITSKRKAILLRGMAGTGKTQLTYLVARYINAEYIFFQCTYGSSEDDLLYKYVPTEETKSGIKITLGPIPRALKMSQNRKVVLVLDEFDKTRPSADALLLDVLQNFRVSIYIDDKEAIVQGNPENLVIFLTSNEMREFSEPLLRRVVVVTLEPLPPAKVLELLMKKFKKETAILLTQIYADTVNAQLRKPATIQELYQLGEVIDSGVQTSLENLLRYFIIKYDDDWKKYLSYIASRKAYEMTIHSKSKENNEDIAKYYEPEENTEIKTDKENAEEKESVMSLLDKIRKVHVKSVEERTEPMKIDSSEKIEVSLKMPDTDFDAYTTVIKTLNPNPTDDPRKFGKFEYVEDEMTAIISRETLTVDEVFKIVSRSDIDVEAYYEDEILTFKLNDDIKSLIEKSTKIKYYANNKIFIVSERKGVTEKLVVEKINSNIIKVKGYINRICGNSCTEDQKRPTILEKIYDLKEITMDLGYVVEKIANAYIKNEIDVKYIPEGSICRDYVPNIVAKTLDVIRKYVKNASININIDGSYNICIEKSKDKVNIKLGYSVKSILNRNDIEGRFDINDEKVEKIIDILKGAK